MRNHFDEQLDLLNSELEQLGALCEDSIANAIRLLLEQDNDSDKLAEIYDEIRRKERNIESLCMKLLLRQQPVAKDLRIISAALKMVYDMQRIGNQSADIAELTNRIEKADVKNKTHIKKMTVAVIKMVTESITSFVKKDLEMAKGVIEYDDVVDVLFDKIKQELMSIVVVGGKDGEQCIDLLMVAKYLERIGDHAVNIAGWVCYSITGQHVNEN